MTHTIARVRTVNPMWYFERNYAALTKLLMRCRVLERGEVRFRLGGNLVELNQLERSRYTLLLAIRQGFSETDKSHLIEDIQFRVRLYLDAKLAEVVSYQGHQGLQPRYVYPNRQMYYPDEKRQTNLILFDWLSSCFKLNFTEIF